MEREEGRWRRGRRARKRKRERGKDRKEGRKVFSSHCGAEVGST